MSWHRDCDFPPVIEASFVPIEGLSEREEPHNHATAFGLAHVELEDGEEQGPQGVVYLFHPPAFDAPHWEVLGYCVRKNRMRRRRPSPSTRPRRRGPMPGAWRWRSWLYRGKNWRTRPTELPGLLVRMREDLFMLFCLQRNGRFQAPALLEGVACQGTC